MDYKSPYVLLSEDRSMFWLGVHTLSTILTYMWALDTIQNTHVVKSFDSVTADEFQKWLNMLPKNIDLLEESASSNTSSDSFPIIHIHTPMESSSKKHNTSLEEYQYNTQHLLQIV